MANVGNGPSGYVLTGNGTNSPPTWQASSTINYEEGTFVPTLDGSSPGTTTYGGQYGYYIRVGNVITVQGNVFGPSATGTGDLTIGGFPYPIRLNTGGNPLGSVLTTGVYTWPALTTSMVLLGISGGSSALVYCSGSGTGGGTMQMANTGFNWQFTMTYEI